MIVYGKNQVEELLKYGGKIKALYVRDSFIPRGIIKKFMENNSHLVSRVNQRELEKIANSNKARDVIAVLEEFTYHNALDLVENTLKNRGVLVYLDHVEDPVNLGAIIRSAAAFNASGIIIPKNRACKVTPTVIRVSEGFAFRVPVALITNPINFIKEVKKEGLFVISLERGGSLLSKLKLPGPSLLVAGSEGRGVSQKIVENSDLVVSIEQSKEVNSLNVHVAVSIALWKMFTENQELCRKK